MKLQWRERGYGFQFYKRPEEVYLVFNLLNMKGFKTSKSFIDIHFGHIVSYDSTTHRIHVPTFPIKINHSCRSHESYGLRTSPQKKTPISQPISTNPSPSDRKERKVLVMQVWAARGATPIFVMMPQATNLQGGSRLLLGKVFFLEILLGWLLKFPRKYVVVVVFFLGGGEGFFVGWLLNFSENSLHFLKKYDQRYGKT